MIARATTWADVWPYAYVQDKTGETWSIVEEKKGWLKLRNRHNVVKMIPRPEDDTAVVTLEMTEPEVKVIIDRHFPGAQILSIIET